MRKLIFILIFFTIGLETFSQNLELIVDCQKLILSTFKYEDFNPIHQAETDSINSKFQAVLLRRDNTTIKRVYDKEIESLFHWIYDNGINEYEDSPDYRRQKMRRSICFASIALISDLDKASTFVEYAKLSLIETINTPDDELLENQYLGLMIIETMLKIEADRLTKNDIESLDSYLSIKKDMIDKKNYLDSRELIEKCQLIIN